MYFAKVTEKLLVDRLVKPFLQQPDLRDTQVSQYDDFGR